MRALFLFIALSLASGVLAQDDDTLSDTIDSSRFVFPFELMVGSKVYNTSFYNQLNSPDNYALMRPPAHVGLAIHGQWNVNRSFFYYGHLAVLFVVPQKVVISGYEGKLNGFTFSASVFGVDLLRKRQKTDLILSVGFNTGRLRIFRSELLTQKNPFFSPFVSFVPRFTAGKITFGFNFMVDYDISGLNWRRTLFTSANKIILDKFQQSGFSAAFFIGRSLN